MLTKTLSARRFARPLTLFKYPDDYIVGVWAVESGEYGDDNPSGCPSSEPVVDPCDSIPADDGDDGDDDDDACDDDYSDDEYDDELDDDDCDEAGGYGNGDEEGEYGCE